MKPLHEPTVEMLAHKNRQLVNAHFDERIPTTLHAIRSDLQAQHCEPASAADQVAAVHQVLKRLRTDTLREASKLARSGYQITNISVTGTKMRIEKARAIRSISRIAER